MTARSRGAHWARIRQGHSLSGGAATWGPRAAGRERMAAGWEVSGFSRELDMALGGPQRGMKMANFRESRSLEVGQTSRSVQQATGQEAGPTRQQRSSGEGMASAAPYRGHAGRALAPGVWKFAAAKALDVPAAARDPEGTPPSPDTKPISREITVLGHGCARINADKYLAQNLCPSVSIRGYKLSFRWYHSLPVFLFDRTGFLTCELSL